MQCWASDQMKVFSIGGGILCQICEEIKKVGLLTDRKYPQIDTIVPVEPDTPTLIE